jgi:hypothetical protein
MDKSSVFTSFLVTILMVYRISMLILAGLYMLSGYIAFTGICAGAATLAKLSARSLAQPAAKSTRTNQAQ